MNSHRQPAMTAALQSQLSRRQLMAGIRVTLPDAIAATHLAKPSTVSAQSMETNSVVIGMHEDIEFLNVLYTQGGNSLSSSKLAQRGLLFTDAEANWVGELATDVPTLENGGVSEDGLTITYKLRDGVTWHDGEPVTSADVKATWEMIMNPDYAVITRFGYDRIGSVDTPDPLTVVVTSFPRSPLTHVADVVLTTAAPETTFRLAALSALHSQLLVLDLRTVKSRVEIGHQQVVCAVLGHGLVEPLPGELGLATERDR